MPITTTVTTPAARTEALEAEIEALLDLIRGLELRRALATSTVDLDLPAGALARQLRARLGRRRFSLLHTKAGRLIEAEPRCAATWLAAAAWRCRGRSRSRSRLSPPGCLTPPPPPEGCPLSPLIGAFFLRRLDARMEQLGLFYVRFMDDILVLAPTRGSCAGRWR